MRLYLERGFDETTVEDIASAAEISPSTFFNYFPSKEAVVFQDDLDPLILDAFNSQPPGVPPIAALRLAMRDVFAQLSDSQEAILRQRMRLLAVTPGLRAAMLNEFAILVDQIATLLASRTGRPTDDFAIHNIAGALLGVLMSAMMDTIKKPEEDMVAAAVRSLEHLEAGLPLDWPEGKSR